MIFLISANIRKKCIPAEPSQTDDWFMASFLEHCGQKCAIRPTFWDVYVKNTPKTLYTSHFQGRIDRRASGRGRSVRVPSALPGRERP